MRDPAFAQSLGTILRGAALVGGLKYGVKMVDEKHQGHTLVTYYFPEKGAFEVARDLGGAVTTHAGVWGATGIGVHSLLDGVAVGEAFRAGAAVGWIVAFAVPSHSAF